MNTADPVMSSREGGFTLLEILVVTGLLGMLLTSLIQLTSSGAELYQRGEAGQELADRALAAARPLREALTSLAGPEPGWRGDDGQAARLPDARLLLHPIALGLRSAEAAAAADPDPAPGSASGPVEPTTVQALRSTIQLAPDREEALLATAVRAFVERTEGGIAEEALVKEQLAAWPRRGRGELLLLVWPLDRTGVFLELRMGEQLIDPELREPGDLPLPAIASAQDLALERDRVLATTRTIASGLLHFEIEFWSQRTLAWNNHSGRGPERSWDSARAGLLASVSESEPGFGLELETGTLGDPRDDVWPRWARITFVVARHQATAPESYLAQPLSAVDTALTVTRPEELPDPTETPWLKIDAEWIRYSELVGRTATGLRRGERGTVAREHVRGAPVRAGREVVLYIPLAVGRDSDG